MTNLTSEQYRDVIKNVDKSTEKIPTVQQLLRLATKTFFERFGAYPEMGGVAPGKMGMFGDQIQFDNGLSLTAATSLATVVVGRKVAGNRMTVVTSADVGKPHKVKFSFSRHRPLGTGFPRWLDRVKGVIDNFEEDAVPGFEAAIESSIPMGVGLGSTSGLQVATYTFLEVLVGKKSDPIAKVQACQKAEAFAGKEVGTVDRMTSVFAKDRHAMVIDCKTNQVEWVPFPKSEVVFVVVDCHVEDTVFGYEYPERSRYLKKACEILQVESLRECTEEDLQELELRVNEILEGAAEEEDLGEDRVLQENLWTEEEYFTMIKRAKFFITEIKRIEEAVLAWKDGNIESFGEKMQESHRALKENFDMSNPLADFLVETSLQVEGVLGSKMMGMGLVFGGTIISLMHKKKVKYYCAYVSQMFEKFEGQIANGLREAKEKEEVKRFEVEKTFLSAGRGALGLRFEARQKSFSEGNRACPQKKKAPCVVEGSKGRCYTYAHRGSAKEEFQRGKSLSNAEKKARRKISEKSKISSSKSVASFRTTTVSTDTEASNINLSRPTFYLMSPFAGARMVFVTRTDLLRSLFTQPVPDPKALVRAALREYNSKYGTKLEAIGLAPATVTLFGEFMEFHRGYVMCMALPMYTITLGGRNDGVHFAVTTLSEEVAKPTEMKCPLPCIRSLQLESRNWVNFVMSSVNEFKEHVPGFNGVIHSSVPIEVGVNSCAALQASLYTFLEGLTREGTEDFLEKADRCSKSEYEFLPEPSEMTTRCSTLKFLPTFLSQEGHLTFINFKRYKISHYFFDHPSYVFLVAYCKKNETKITIQDLEDRLKQCKEAIDVLERNSLLGADLNHLRCLSKHVDSEDVVKRARYVITEHERAMQAVAAVKAQDYDRVGVLMTESHASLRDDYGISCPQIESLIALALEAGGVLGAKMLGRGLNAAIIILININDADHCMRYMRDHYKKKKDELVFYMTKPSQGAFAMDPESVSLIP